MEDSSHKYTGHLVKILYVIEKDGRVFPSKFKAKGSQRACSREGNMVSDRTRPDESYMTYIRMGGEMRRRLRPTQHRLDKVVRVAARDQGCASNGSEILSRPRSRLGGFDNECRAGEKGGYQRTHEVVELGHELADPEGMIIMGVFTG